MFALFPEFGARTRPQDLWPFLISETGLNFLIWTQGEIHPGNRASPVNRENVFLRMKAHCYITPLSNELVDLNLITIWVISLIIRSEYAVPTKRAISEEL